MPRLFYAAAGGRVRQRRKLGTRAQILTTSYRDTVQKSGHLPNSRRSKREVFDHTRKVKLECPVSSLAPLAVAFVGVGIFFLFIDLREGRQAPMREGAAGLLMLRSPGFLSLLLAPAAPASCADFRQMVLPRQSGVT